jgi:hypothetical protein
MSLKDDEIPKISSANTKKEMLAAGQKAQIETLSAQLDNAYRKVQDIAIKPGHLAPATAPGRPQG